MDRLKKEYCEQLINRIIGDIKKYWTIINERPRAVVVSRNEYDMLEDYYKQSLYYNPHIKSGVYTIMGVDVLMTTDCGADKLYYIAF